jgi:hypothetical protein
LARGFTRLIFASPDWRQTLDVLKLLGIVLLCIASIAVLLGMIVPVAASGILGLGIEVPNFWTRMGRVVLVYSYPWVSLFVGMLLLAVFGWGLWRLIRA